MGIQLANGSTLSIASTYDSSIAVTAVTNADPAVATTAANTYAAGDIIEVTSGWSRLSGRVVRASAASSTSVTLDGIDTSNTKYYSAGSGVGSVRKVLTWQDLSQVTGFDSSGGDQQYVQYQPLDATQETQVPTIQSAQTITLTIADDPSLAQYPILQAATLDRRPRAIRLTLPDGSANYYNCYVSLNSTPKLGINAINTVTVSLALSAALTRYASSDETT